MNKGLESEDDEEMSLSLHRKSRKLASKTKKLEEVKSSDPHDEVENIENVQQTSKSEQANGPTNLTPRGRRGRPRKSFSKSEMAEALPSNVEADVSVSKVEDPKAERSKDLFDFDDEDITEPVQQIMRRNKPLGRPRKSSNLEIPATNDAIKTEEEIPDKAEQVVPAKKKVGRPKKKAFETSEEAETSEEEAALLTRTSFNETSFADEKSTAFVDSDSEENVPLKSRKRKNSEKLKPKVEEAFNQSPAKDGQVVSPDETTEQVDPYQESNKTSIDQPVRAAETGVRKRGRPKKVKIADTMDVIETASKREENDVFDFNEDEDSDDADWLSQDRKLKQKLKEKLNRPRQRSSSFCGQPCPESPTPKRERFFSEDSPDSFEPVGTSQSDADDAMSNNNFENDAGSISKYDDMSSDVRSDEQQQQASRGIKRRRSSFANSFYSQGKVFSLKCYRQ